MKRTTRSLTRLVGFPISLLLAFGHAHAATELGWDLSYQRALQAQHMGSQEFMPIWIARYPKRPIHQKLQEYKGEAIEASLLIEKPDSHAGDPLAHWFVLTKRGAKACSFHEKFMNEPCKDLDRAKMARFIKEVSAFSVLPPQDSKEMAIGKDHKGEPILLNYIGFLSVYQHGVVSQRPIAALEMGEVTGLPAWAHDPQTGRLNRAMEKLFLSDEAFKQRQVAEQMQARQQALLEAVRTGDIDAAAKLLDQGVPMAAPAGDSPWSLLAAAAGKGQIKMVDFLLERGAKIDAVESAALKSAVAARDMAMLAHLLGKGAKVDPPEDSLNAYHHVYESALGLAVSLGYLDVAEWLIGKGADVNIRQATPIISVAVTTRNLALMELLLAHGANPNGLEEAPDRAPLRVLMYGSGNLSGLPTDPKALQQIEQTEASLAVFVRRLVAAGADVNLADKGCQTPYQEASDRHSKGMTALLIELGADPKAGQACEARRRCETR